MSSGALSAESLSAGPWGLESLGPEGVEAAAERIADLTRRTPVLRDAELDRLAGASCYLKAENLQCTGAFKVRGAAAALTASTRRTPVVTASAGNFGQGVALAARSLGREALVFVPTGAPRVKRRRIRRFGADVRSIGRDFDETDRLARQFAAAEDLEFLPPFDHPRVIEGQGTLVREFLEEVPQLDALVVPCGGGGLLAGAV
ncbi:MAG: pyridoxal-phosphate dependent enzyme, partial [Acidobacteriota bacterium]